jgi:hypothetical protein
LSIGPVSVDAPEVHDAFWVVDGQQRLTALAGALLHPEAPSGDERDPYQVCFLPETGEFVSSDEGDRKRGVPLNVLLDATELGEWLMDSPFRERELRRRVFEAGRRIREYSFPLYVVDQNDDDEKTLREMFYRVNKSGKPLEWEDVYGALLGNTGGEPSTLEALARTLRDLGMGEPDREALLPMVVASAGLDPTRNLGDHLSARRDDVPEVATCAPAIRSALSFARRECRIPHLRLLPHRDPLVVLARFFRLHPEPSARTRELLRRWVWRGLRTGVFGDRSARTLLRRAVTAISDSEPASVQALLALVPRGWEGALDMPESFDARHAESRLVLLAAAQMSPRRLDDGRAIEVGTLLEANQADAFRRILSGGSRGPENRILHPSGVMPWGEIRRLAESATAESKAILHSHGIDDDACAAARADDSAKFLAVRARALTEALDEVAERLGAPGRSDRPAIDELLRGTGSEG